MEGTQNSMLIYDPWGILKVRIVEDLLKKFNKYTKLQQTLIAGLVVAALDKKYLEYTFNIFRGWVYIFYVYCKNLRLKEKHIRTRIIHRISDERKINTLYECMSWYITNQVEYPDEKRLKCITYDDFERAYKNPALLLRIEQNNERSLTYNGREIKFELSIGKVNIDGEDHSRQNDTITLSLQTNNPNDKFLENEFIPWCMECYTQHLKTKNYQSAVYQNMDSEWKEISKQPAELRDTIILKGNDKQFLMDEVTHFINNKQWYYDHGFPYSLGVLLHGEPGCGKTSLIRLISHITKRNTHYLRLSQIRDEKQFNTLLEKLSRETTILVLEDIDCVDWVRERSDKEEIFNVVQEHHPIQPTPVQITIGDNKNDGTSLTAKNDKINLEILLSILDGMRTTPGQITFITTNHSDKLDKALVRDGRIDIKMELKLCDRDMINRLGKQFYKKPFTLSKENTPEKHSPAHVMNIFRRYRNNMQTAINELEKDA